MTGDGNVVQTTYQQVILPSPDSVDIAAELRALREVLAGLDTPDRRKIENAFSDVDDELARHDPDRDEVGGAMDRALRYASRAKDFAAAAENLAPHVKNAAAWLGQNWHKIPAVVGLSV